MREFNLVSAPFASGLAWLVNILLELDVRTTHVSPRYPHGFWRAQETGSADVMTAEAEEFMGWHLPAVFARKDGFRFEPELQIFWEHRLDFSRHSQRPTLVFVRDPRDAIYSLHRRDYAASIPFASYLTRPDRFPDHFPGMFDLPPADTWAAWHAHWLGLKPVTPVQVVRFEALRAEPLAGMREILAFLGVRRTDAEIERALAASTFERAREAMLQQEQRTGTPRETARRGKTGEWKETYTPDLLEWFSGPAREIMAQLGYATDNLGEPWPETAGLQDPALPLRPAIAEALDVARAAWLAGKAPDAAAVLARAGAQAGRHIVSRLQLAADAVAYDWTLNVFGTSLMHSPAAAAALQAYRDFLRRFAPWPPVQRMLLAALDALPESPASGPFDLGPLNAHAPSAPEEPPQLVQAGYRGFNLVRFRRQVHALAQALGPVNLEGLSAEDWAALQAYGGILSGRDADRTRAAVDHFCRTGQAPAPTSVPPPTDVAEPSPAFGPRPGREVAPSALQGATTIPGSPFVLNFEA